MTTPTPDSQTLPFGSPPRQLQEEVLQSAEEAVLTNPASVDGLDPLGISSGLVPAENGQARLSYRDAVARYVARKPWQSALVAATLGALAASLVMRSTAQRHGR